MDLKRYSHLFPEIKNLAITRSERKDKRFTAHFTIRGTSRKINFGQPGAYTYYDWILEGRPADIASAMEVKRAGYRARAAEIRNGEGKRTAMVPGTANSFAFWLLW